MRFRYLGETSQKVTALKPWTKSMWKQLVSLQRLLSLCLIQRVQDLSLSEFSKKPYLGFYYLTGLTLWAMNDDRENSCGKKKKHMHTNTLPVSQFDKLRPLVNDIYTYITLLTRLFNNNNNNKTYLLMSSLLLFAM